RADGIDVEGRRPQRPTPADVAGAAAVVTFACDLGELAVDARRIERWDDVPAVSEDFKRARDVIVARVTGLLEDRALGTCRPRPSRKAPACSGFSGRCGRTFGRSPASSCWDPSGASS